MSHVCKRIFWIQALIKQLLTKYQIFTILPQISHFHKYRNFSSNICNLSDQLLHPYKFHGRDMSGILFFIFASWNPLNWKEPKTTNRNQLSRYLHPCLHYTTQEWHCISSAKLHTESSLDHAWWCPLHKWYDLEDHPDLPEELRILSGNMGIISILRLPPPKKIQKFAIFDNTFDFWFCPSVPTNKIFGNTNSCTQAFRSPHKKNSKGVKFWDLGEPLYQFNFNQLAQILFHLTVLILACAVMHDIWFDETSTKRHRRNYQKNTCQNILHILEHQKTAGHFKVYFYWLALYI